MVLVLFTLVITTSFAQDAYKPSADTVKMERELAAFPGWIAAQEKKVEDLVGNERTLVAQLKAIDWSKTPIVGGLIDDLRTAVEKRVRAQMRLDELRSLFRTYPRVVRTMKESDRTIWESRKALREQ
jgi:hypothetical protein